MVTFIDLFCGIGGFRHVLQNKGLECVFSSDIDPYAQSAYFHNYGERPYGDITTIPEKKIPKHDVLCAGFPCQSFSISGKQLGVTDSRGRLFYEIIRIAEYHQPSILLLENVKNIVTIDNGKVMKTIEDKLNEIGYDLYRDVLNSSYYGIPQSRERVYFVGIRKDIKGSYKYTPPKKTYKKIFLEDILENQVEKDLYIDRKDIYLKDVINIRNDFKPLRIGFVNKGGQGERIYSPKGHAITLSAYGGGIGAKTGLYYTENGIRRLTIPESKKVMGFPDNYYISDGNQGYQQLGNAVVPGMIDAIWDNIRMC